MLLNGLPSKYQCIRIVTRILFLFQYVPQVCSTGAWTLSVGWEYALFSKYFLGSQFRASLVGTLNQGLLNV